MRFVTEIELKTSYRQSPFARFRLAEDQRLTPEARQFLMDRQIEIQLTEERQEAQPRSLPNQQLIIVCQKLSSLLLLGFSLLLETQIELAEQVMIWQADVERLQDGGEFRELRDESNEAFTPQLITPFHIQLAQGRDIAMLHCIRASLCELDFLLSDRRNQQVDEERLSQEKRMIHQIAWELDNNLRELIKGGGK